MSSPIWAGAALAWLALCVSTWRGLREARRARDEAMELVTAALGQEERLLDALAWMARGNADDLACEFAAIEDYCRRVVAGEQDTAPAAALRHIQTTAGDALKRVIAATPTPRGEG